jgi:hypothetical protein
VIGEKGRRDVMSTLNKRGKQVSSEVFSSTSEHPEFGMDDKYFH